MISIKYSHEDRLYTVGLETRNDRDERQWFGLVDCETLDQAIQAISYLNGGTRPGFLDR